MTQFVKVAFEVEIEEGDEYPSSMEIVNALQGGLPKEWWVDHREAYWGLAAIYALNDDGTLQQSDTTLRPRSTQDRVRMLTAELAQERKLTTHLDEQIKSLELDKSAMAGTITGQGERIRNLVEKNDNQVKIINEYLKRGLDLQRKYDDSLIDWKAMQKQRDDAIERADRNYNNLEDGKQELAKANGEAQAHANMIGKIVDAMEGAGYDISGWGNDVQLEELETAIGGVTNGLEDASSEASIITQKLDEIRTQR